MTLYLLNSPILTDYGLWRLRGPLSIDEAGKRAAVGFVSAIGHAASAHLLSEILGVDVPVARIRARLAPGDEAIVLRLRDRLPAGAVLDEATLRTLPFDLSLLTRLE